VASSAELAAMERALRLAASAGTLQGSNPRVGCVILDSSDVVIAEGAHLGAGTDHAEVVALKAAGPAAAGATAVVTLEPCNHTGRTGPCVEALIDAGVMRVVFGQSDPHSVAQGGADALQAAGIAVEGGVLQDDCTAINSRWSAAVQRGWPWVIWKVAATLDGRICASDGTATWITGEAARTDAHRLRADVDAILVGTTTAISDNPQLNVRLPDFDGVQPLPVVMGLRDIPETCLVSSTALHVRTRDPHEVLRVLHEREIRTLMIEGGATVAAAFLQAGLVDEVRWYVAPAVLGAGTPAIGDFGISTLADRVELKVFNVQMCGTDVRIDAYVVKEI
jgi:diaminohydroxyphosphoribosylaminopyrimidine deaminase/5-amino-6-(5-phosphoribosylamino)uracil reductase